MRFRVNWPRGYVKLAQGPGQIGHYIVFHAVSCKLAQGTGQIGPEPRSNRTLCCFSCGLFRVNWRRGQVKLSRDPVKSETSLSFIRFRVNWPRGRVKLAQGLGQIGRFVVFHVVPCKLSQGPGQIVTGPRSNRTLHCFSFVFV